MQGNLTASLLLFFHLLAASSASLAQGEDAYRAYMVKMQDAMIETYKDFLSESPAALAEELRSLGIAFTTTSPGDKEGYCASPWSMAVRSEYKGKPLIVICPYAMSTYADYFVAAQLALATKADLRKPKTILEFNDREFMSNVTFDLARAYLSHAAAIHTASMTGGNINRCNPIDAAYAVLNKTSVFPNCTSPNAKSRTWLKTLDISEADVTDLWRGNLHGIAYAVIAHEVGHIVEDKVNGHYERSGVDDEMAADLFALKHFRTSVGSAGYEMAFMNLQFLWAHAAVLGLTTRYPLPSHEKKRLNASGAMILCDKNRIPYGKESPPELVQIVESYRRKLLESGASQLCR